ncbi:hypothetical protein NFJ02_26g61860 [Pycnococcus provasolii]
MGSTSNNNVVTLHIRTLTTSSHPRSVSAALGETIGDVQTRACKDIVAGGSCKVRWYHGGKLLHASDDTSQVAAKGGAIVEVIKRKQQNLQPSPQPQPQPPPQPRQHLQPITPQPPKSPPAAPPAVDDDNPPLPPALASLSSCFARVSGYVAFVQQQRLQATLAMINSMAGEVPLKQLEAMSTLCPAVIGVRRVASSAEAPAASSVVVDVRVPPRGRTARDAQAAAGTAPLPWRVVSGGVTVGGAVYAGDALLVQPSLSQASAASQDPMDAAEQELLCLSSKEPEQAAAPPHPCAEEGRSQH